jgi:hypothetical protein
MKKQFLFSILLLIALINSRSAKSDSIPNGDFELWYTTTWFDFPAGWMTNNNQIIAPMVVKDTDSYNGIYAVQLYTSNNLIPEASCGFPLTQHPFNVGGYCKNTLITGDSAEIVVRIYHNQQLTDSGRIVFFGGINPFYSSFVIPLSQSSTLADSCYIVMHGGTSGQVRISFDDLDIDFGMSVPENDKSGGLIIYPNPSSNKLIISMPGRNLADGFRAFVYDNNGKLHAEISDIHFGPMIINTETLAAGNYIITVSNGKERFSRMWEKH